VTAGQHHSPQLPILVFTDLDGTLLDHDTYEFADALPALKLLQSLNIPLIPTTSKTVAEVLQISHRLDNPHPFIAENGCIIGLPDGYFNETDLRLISGTLTQKHTSYTLLTLAPLYAEVLSVLQLLRDKQGFRFQGFNDMTACEISKLTQLPLPRAELAKQRMCSEPLIWLGDDVSLQAFKAALQQHDLQLVQGGRFWHVFGHTDKGFAMQQLIALYQRHGIANATTIAVGDSPNDIDMLDKAHIAIVIKRKDGSKLAYPEKDKPRNHVIVSDKPGPAGWNNSLADVIQQLQSNTIKGIRHV
jgi:mannosyl-3-phosphoglycerate phosphatase